MNTIKRSLVDENVRLDFLPHHLGRWCVMFEGEVFDWMRALTQYEYQGGFWDFYELSNGGFYIGLQEERSFRLFCSGNGFEGELSASAASIVACLFALSSLSFKAREDHVADHYHRLLAYVEQHPERALIYQAID